MFGVEAWKAKERLPRVALTAFAVLFALTGSFLKPLSEGVPSIGAFIAGVFALPASWFALFLSLFFVLRPYWTSGQAFSRDAGTRQDISHLETYLSKAQVDLEQQFASIKASLSEHEIAFRESVNKIEKEIASHAAQIFQINTENGERQRIIGANSQRIENLYNTVEDHRDKVLHSLHAIGAISRLADTEAQIRSDAAELYDRLRAGEKYDTLKWRQWENVHDHWMQCLTTWLDNGTWYAVAVKGRTLTVNDAKYGQDWTVSDDQFPNAEAVRVFKKFRIIHTQWEEVVPDVKDGMEKVAFVGMTEEEARHGRPAG